MKDFLAIDRIERAWPEACLIDVTLRDGGFRTQFDWTLEEVITIATASTLAGVDLVELGYIGGVPELHHMPNVGISADLTPEIISRIASSTGNGRLCAMVHPSASRTSISFGAFREAGLEMVRIVYHHSWQDRFRDLARQARAAGLRVAGNIALASRYHPDELAEAAASIAASVDIVYLADTCGALFPSETDSLVQRLKPLADVGFHGHDYLSMALANAHASACAGAKWIDASIWGIGRGAGNLRLELWMALRQAHMETANVRLAELLPAMHCIKIRLGAPALPDLAALVCGALNLTPPQEDELRNQATKRAGSLEHAAVLLLQNGANGRSVVSAVGTSGLDEDAVARP